MIVDDRSMEPSDGARSARVILTAAMAIFTCCARSIANRDILLLAHSRTFA